MAFLRLKKSAWTQATWEQREVLTAILDHMGLGDHFWSFANKNNVHWHFYQDHDIDYMMCALLGCLFANQAAIFGAWDPPRDTDGAIDVDMMMEELAVLLADPGLDNPLVLDEPSPEDKQPWQTILDAQACPNFCKITRTFPNNYDDVTPYPFGTMRVEGQRRDGRIRYGKGLQPKSTLVTE